MTELTWHGWLTFATLVTVIYLLFSERLSADAATLSGLFVLIVSGAVDVEDGLAGFANPGVLTIGLLFVVAETVRRSGGLIAVTRGVLVRTSSLRYGLARMMIPTTVVSAFMNNTPVVALLLAEMKSWARRNDFPVTKVLIPLSYAAIMGGACTLIGTSTNLVVNGLLEEAGRQTIGFFDVGAVGLPIAILGTLFLLFFGPSLLPAHGRETGGFKDPALFTTEMLVIEGAELDGTPLEEADVGDLHGVFPVEVRRDGAIIPAPPPEFALQAGDRIVLAGDAEEMMAIRKSDAVELATTRKFDFAEEEAPSRSVVEVILSDHCPLIGASVGDGTFRKHYGAAVIAASRRGEVMSNPRLGDWSLRIGDRLLLEAGPGFEQHAGERDFFLVTDRPDLLPDVDPPGWRRWISLAVVVAMIICAATQVTSILVAAMAAAVVLVAVNDVSGADIRDAVDWQVILTIAAAFGIASAARSTGLAEVLAGSIVSLGTSNAWLSLGMVYLATFLLTELITNNAAAALAFPLALAVADTLGVSPTPFAIAVMIAASASFMTPLGYQTNLMVYGAGDYRVRDFIRVGFPMALIAAAAGIFLTPFFFPF